MKNKQTRIPRTISIQNWSNELITQKIHECNLIIVVFAKLTLVLIRIMILIDSHQNFMIEYEFRQHSILGTHFLRVQQRFLCCTNVWTGKMETDDYPMLRFLFYLNWMAVIKGKYSKCCFWVTIVKCWTCFSGFDWKMFIFHWNFHLWSTFGNYEDKGLIKV